MPHLPETQTKKKLVIDIRGLEMTEVCGITEWLSGYMRLENTQITDSKQLINVLVKNTREYESDLGLYGVED